MNIPLPSNAPGWAGWAVALLALVAWALDHRNRIATTNSAVRKEAAEARKVDVETLGAVSKQIGQQLRDVRVALAPDEADIVGVVTTESGISRKLVAYVKANRDIRTKARAELPALLERITAIQRKHADMVREIAAGLPVNDAVVKDLGRDVAEAVEHLGEFLKLLAEPPRVQIGPFPPTGSRAGDLWLDTSRAEEDPSGSE